MDEKGLREFLEHLANHHVHNKNLEEAEIAMLKDITIAKDAMTILAREILYRFF